MDLLSERTKNSHGPGLRKPIRKGRRASCRRARGAPSKGNWAKPVDYAPITSPPVSAFPSGTDIHVSVLLRDGWMKRRSRIGLRQHWRRAFSIPKPGSGYKEQQDKGSYREVEGGFIGAAPLLTWIPVPIKSMSGFGKWHFSLEIAAGEASEHPDALPREDTKPHTALCAHIPIPTPLYTHRHPIHTPVPVPVHTSTHTCTRTPLCILLCVHLCTPVHATCVHSNTCTCTYPCIHLYSTYLYIHLYMCLYSTHLYCTYTCTHLGTHL